MDISKSPLKLGLTIDLGNYGINPSEKGEYIKWFADDTWGEGPKILHVYTIDRYVHNKSGVFTFQDKKRLEDEIGKFALFVGENFPQVEVITFQFPYNQLPSELGTLFDLDFLYGSIELNTQRNRLEAEGKLLNLGKAQEMVLSYLDVVSNAPFSYLLHPPIVLFHSGGILPNDLITSDRGLDINNFIKVRNELINRQTNYHKTLLNYVNEKNIIIGLENIPIWDNCTSPHLQWLSEHAFEDFENRFILGGIHAIDLPHVAMNSAYFSQDKLKFLSMEMILDEFDGVPPSLKSIKDYIMIASNFFAKKTNNDIPKIIYHVADCNGLYGDNEGVCIGIKDSVINWKDFVDAVKNFTPGAYGAIEVQNSHLKENYDSHVRQSLRNFLSYCE